MTFFEHFLASLINSLSVSCNSKALCLPSPSNTLLGSREASLPSPKVLQIKTIAASL